MIRVAICDDNVHFANYISEIIGKSIKKYTSDTELEVYYSGISLLNQHCLEPFNIIFMDIDMPAVSGFDVARILRDDFSGCFIIFVTNHPELVFDSMDYQPFHFIRKNCSTPVAQAVDNVVQKLMKHMKQNEKIVLKDISGMPRVVFVHNIVYLESDKHYICFYISDKSVVKVRGNISEYESAYSEYNFVRIHKKFLVNIKYLSFLDEKKDEVAISILDKRLIMSRNYKKMVKEKYICYSRSMV